MNGNLFRKELKRNLVRFLVWTGVIVAFELFTVAIVPSMIGGSAARMAAFLEIYPDALRKAFGFDLAAWSSPLGIYATYHVFYGLIFGSIFAVSYGIDTLAGEEQRRTAEFLLTRPISRGAVVASKLLAFLVYLAGVNLAAAGAAAGGLVAFTDSPVDLHAFAVLSGYCALATLLFGSLGILLSVALGRARGGPAIGTGIVLGAYFVDAFAKASEKARPLGWVSPFKYADTEVTRAGYAMEWPRLAYFLGLSIVFVAAAWLAYRRKDIHA